MRLTKIEITRYKSIKEPVAISFLEGLPTVLIGKNGSGKTNVLEALEAIALENSDDSHKKREKERPAYRVYIQLSEEDLKTISPEIVYDKEKCEIVAYSSGNGLKIDTIQSEYIVPSFKKEIIDIRGLVSQLGEAVDEYKKQFNKILHGEDSGWFDCHEVQDPNSIPTNYEVICFRVKSFIERITFYLDEKLKNIDDDEETLALFEVLSFPHCIREAPSFRLEYKEPSLAEFEKRFISIDTTAIKREIAKINKATKNACERIEELMKEIEGKIGHIREEWDNHEEQTWFQKKEGDQRYHSFVDRVKHIIGRSCLFFKNESTSLIFRQKNLNDDPYGYFGYINYIKETYLRQVYDGPDREELLKCQNKWDFSPEAIADLEAFLNKNIPPFDNEMYKKISVRTDGKGPISIFVEEKTGEQINLDETSAGRRWYFTYYFMKSILRPGDIFIIDEPAEPLHPCAQRDVLRELMELTRQGIKVVYSTHSPYLIPEERQCVHFVTMTEKGTKINGHSSEQELVRQMADIVGEDIFVIQGVFDKYIFATPEEVARNISDLIRDTQKKVGIKNLEIVCEQIGIKYEALKSWNESPKKPNGEKNKKFASPCREHIAKVLQWAKKHNNLR